MRTVLITGTYFAEEVFLGSLRLTALARFLPEYGWRPLILTPALQGPPAVPRGAVELVEYPDPRAFYAAFKERTGTPHQVTLAESGSAATPPSRARRVAGATVERAKRLAIPDPSIMWWPFGVRAALRHVRTTGRAVDCVLSSSNPLGPHFIGRSLQSRLRAPWVADFRDLWTLNHYATAGPARARLETALERRLLGSADAIVTISDQYVERLRRHYGDASDRFHVVPLGYDPDIVPTEPTGLTPEFTLTFTGNFVEGKRDPAMLFRGVRLALERGLVDRSALKIRFYGPRYGWIDERAGAEGLGDVLTQHGYVTRDEALLRQRETQLLLLFLWNHPAERGAYSGKMEYLVSGRPIMALDAPPDGIWDRMFAETGAGATLRTPEEVAAYLGDAYSQFVREGAVGFAGDITALRRFDYERLVGDFAAVLSDVAGARARA